ncbi:hypothetical protein CHGG_04708 [Chaetomium globosum CBS 148.51]|uniref:Pentacotripeptide-repeat region of PRORP domain-containing protein n=1 Tax=Chaetomium globosum (strain ATCC 6205 / CBS 148.51 / DSM 1962 / NBRC 6347 / NRRL 1970) TaxID=306901 RepID=Q2H0I8_CHAGB|nr:uncharacterized protein CHGG_04708 [Chaetomium globosum CBS 148.51]EAQ88089.1 hypothetical protein CHGG_04708 [Chaetomium globosum CBS 148.51]
MMPGWAQAVEPARGVAYTPAGPWGKSLNEKSFRNGPPLLDRDRKSMGSLQLCRRTLPSQQQAVRRPTLHKRQAKQPQRKTATPQARCLRIHANPGPASKPSDTSRVSASTLCQSTSTFPPETVYATTPTIYEALRNLRSWPHQGQAQKIRRLVKYLVENRGERPNVFLYEALVAANWDPATGSADELAEIYKEMRTANIQPSQAWYHSALRLLAIHPNYLTRKTYLLKLEEQEMELTDDGKASVALGLLRDGQNEMALDYWDNMRSAGTQIPEWLSATFVYVLVLRGFMDEAVQLFRQVLEMAKGNSNGVPLSFWSYILDECSRALHYEGTKLVWDEMVSPGKLNPADGIALNVLNTAGRHGDTVLATAVVELLSARDVKLGYHHYEPLLESYVHAGNMEFAFRVLGIMNDAGIQPDQPSTRAIFSVLKDSARRHRGSHPDHPQPGARTGGGGQRGARSCHRGERHGQDTGRIPRGCRRAEQAVFLVAEMDRFSVRPSPPILDSLVRCFARDGNLGVALLYLDEMSRYATATATATTTAATAPGSASSSSSSLSPSSSPPPSTWVSEATLITVLRRCYREKDERAFALVAEAQKRGMSVNMDMVRRLEQSSQGKFEDELDV